MYALKYLFCSILFGKFACCFSFFVLSFSEDEKITACRGNVGWRKTGFALIVKWKYGNFEMKERESLNFLAVM